MRTHFFDFPGAVGEIKDFKKADMMICSDKLRVKQVLMNLFSNAIKFTKEGNVRIICQYVKGTSYSYVQNSSREGAQVKDWAEEFIQFHHKDEESACIDKVFEQ